MSKLSKNIEINRQSWEDRTAVHLKSKFYDLEAFKKHLDQLEVRYSDWGETAVAGWKQIFFYDPDGNVIEVHEVENK